MFANRMKPPGPQLDTAGRCGPAPHTLLCLRVPNSSDKLLGGVASTCDLPISPFTGIRPRVCTPNDNITAIDNNNDVDQISSRRHASPRAHHRRSAICYRPRQRWPFFAFVANRAGLQNTAAATSLLSDYAQVLGHDTSALTEDHENQGLDIAELAALKETTYPAESVKMSECPVCLTAFKDGQRIKQLPCEHAFCATCTNRWFHSHPTCPLCRHDCRFANGFTPQHRATRQQSTSPTSTMAMAMAVAEEAENALESPSRQQTSSSNLPPPPSRLRRRRRRSSSHSPSPPPPLPSRALWPRRPTKPRAAQTTRKTACRISRRRRRTMCPRLRRWRRGR